MSGPAPTPTRPRRFRFGLRTLFVLVTVVSIATAWVTYSLNWIRQRQEAFSQHVVWEWVRCTTGQEELKAPFAPAGLWLFGESGLDIGLTREQDVARVERLFPEAIIWPSDPEITDLSRRAQALGVSFPGPPPDTPDQLWPDLSPLQEPPKPATLSPTH